MTIKLPTNMQSKIIIERVADCPVPGPCWVWTGCLNSRNYGCASIGGGVIKLTHRIAYVAYKGGIPAGYQVDHLCFNTRCCNPDHLDAVTQKVNAERTRNATKTHCIHGHALAGENLIIKSRPNNLSIRQCRVCVMDAGRRSADKKRQSLRQPSKSWALAREQRRAYLIAAGESALRQSQGRTA